MNLIDLLYLDLSHNRIETLPPQIRRLTQLQVELVVDFYEASSRQWTFLLFLGAETESQSAGAFPIEAAAGADEPSSFAHGEHSAAAREFAGGRFRRARQPGRRQLFLQRIRRPARGAL